MTAKILGIGCCVPNGAIEQQESSDFAIRTLNASEKLLRRIQLLYRRTGIERRHSVLINSDPNSTDGFRQFYPQASNESDRGPSTATRIERYAKEAPALALGAATRALDTSGIAPRSITHIITVSCTGFDAPGIEIALIDRLGLPRTTQRIQVGFMGCHAAINALRVANGLVSENKDYRILICSVELCSLHYQYGNASDHLVSNALFADGAAAIVLSSSEDAKSQDPSHDDRHTDQPTAGYLKGTQSFLIDNSRELMTWKIGNNGFEMSLSAKVPSLIEENLPHYIDTFLENHKTCRKSIGGWAVHPGGTRVLGAVEKSIGLDSQQLAISREVLKKNGNMSSATLLFILKLFQERQVPKPWVLLGFGPGLEIESALID